MMKDSVDLRRVERDLCSEKDPGDQPQHEAEEPVKSARSLEVMSNHVTASGLEDRPKHTPDDHAWNQGTRGHLSRRERTKCGEVERHIDDDGEYLCYCPEPEVVLSERQIQRAR